MQGKSYTGDMKMAAMKIKEKSVDKWIINCKNTTQLLESTRKVCGALNYYVG